MEALAPLPGAEWNLVIRPLADDISAAAGRAERTKTSQLAHGRTGSFSQELADLELDVAAPKRNNFLAGGQRRGRVTERDGGTCNLEGKLKGRHRRRMSQDVDGFQRSKMEGKMSRLPSK